ncbi:MAG: hypothetical protein IOB61_12930 [Aquidulcibacter sp.]|nr:hypothetical protein [Aquidulcibacter sp.]
MRTENELIEIAQIINAREALYNRAEALDLKGQYHQASLIRDEADAMSRKKIPAASINADEWDFMAKHKLLLA